MDQPASEPSPEQNGGTAPSRVVISFPGRGSADCTINAENVTPGQLMAAAYWLDTWLRSQLGPQVAAQGGRLAIPADHLPPGLLRGRG